MFNVRISFARVSQNRRYELFRAYPDTPKDLIRSGRYVGPSLRLILPGLSSLSDRQLLAVLDVPGLPEVRGTSVYAESSAISSMQVRICHGRWLSERCDISQRLLVYFLGKPHTCEALARFVARLRGHHF